LDLQVGGIVFSDGAHNVLKSPWFFCPNFAIHYIVRLRVRPGKKRDVLFQSEEMLVADVSAPARDGKANERLVADLSRWLGCPSSRIRVEKGLSSREKAVSLSGMEDAELRERIARALYKGCGESLADRSPDAPASRK
ncbi:MAG: DUF167 domain-containing protein, partial [Leptospirillum sp.]